MVSKHSPEDGAHIRLRGVRQHNLKNLDLDLPLYRLIAVSGVSGSGKSSLAIHTLYAEGQRRYVETFSPYARQFLERMDRPDADAIEGIPPAIAIESATTVRSSRSTVGTMTEINDHLKYLYARLAVPVCPGCGEIIREESPETVLQSLESLDPESPLLLCFPHTPSGTNWARRLVSQGFLRIYADGAVLDMEDPSAGFSGRPPADGEVLVVVDRLLWKRATPERVLDSLRTAFSMGGGTACVVVPPRRVMRFSQDLSCPRCHVTVEPKSPSLFSFNSPLGACPTCRGFGRIIDVDLDLVIPDKRLSIERGAIRPWTPDRMEFQELMAFCRREGIPTDIPFAELSQEYQGKIIEGTDDYYGIRGFFDWLETKTYKMHVRVFLSRYRAYLPCKACGGSRFRNAVRLYRLRGVTIHELCAWPVGRSLRFFQEPWPELEKDPAAALLCQEIRNRLQFLVDVGLDYLTLDRQSRTLSGGEVQRVHLTRALGSALTNVLYVLDEPSVGLHARDQQRLMNQLHRLVSLGNTAVMVEHDPDMIRLADHVIDMGPGGGERGGRILYQGPPEGLARAEGSLTGRYLEDQGKRTAFAAWTGRPRRRPDASRVLLVRGASENNLKNITVSFPVGCLVGVSGVSGSGKSTLVEDTLYHNWLRLMGRPGEQPGRCNALEGADRVADMVLVDQRPVGRSPRANLLSYTHVLDPIRQMLASTPEARVRGYSAGHFSFNVPGGRCDHCKGEGFLKIEMQFLADAYVRCPVCNGRRFRDEILDVRIKGLSIADILESTATEILEAFPENEAVRKALEPVVALGLDYLRLGQPLTLLSGGEAQRLKLIRYLNPVRAGASSKGTCFLLDEPTVGLHPHDLEKLIQVLHRLVDRGHTVVVVEHNLELLWACDWIIDLGPEGGDGGGTVVAEGPPEEIAANAESHTGRFLASRFLRHETQNAPGVRTARPAAGGSARLSEIIVRGARVHNLQLDEVRFPLNRMTVITGLSGSGKSSLAFDIIFAEGQRRYLECLSTYVRQYFKILEKPDVDQILGLPPTVAIEQRTAQPGKKSTVGTITEIYHFLRLLFARIGRQHCPECGQPVDAMSPDTILHLVDRELAEQPAAVLAPVIRGRKGIYRDLFMRLRQLGYRTVRIDGMLHPLDPVPAIARHREHDIEVVVLEKDVVGSLSQGERQRRIAEALRLGGGTVVVAGSRDRFYSRHLACRRCERSFAPLDPRLFSFNSRLGACLHCEGTGLVGDAICPRCGGTRLNEQARAVQVHGWTIGALTDLPVKEFEKTWKAFPFRPSEEPVFVPISREVVERLGFLRRVGLDYLALSRSGHTLSGGEAQRIRLAAQLGSTLRGVCYILDEPTIGLHPVDNEKLLAGLRELTERGNSVIVVEHDPDTMRCADEILELGPEAGAGGGRLVAQGRYEDLIRQPHTLTGLWFGRTRPIEEPSRGTKTPGHAGWITVRGARANNLKGIDVAFPLQTLCCVTGVSGSGKSTLVHEVLQTALMAIKKGAPWEPSWPLSSLEGHEAVQRVVEVDHTPIGRTPRSTPATYVGIWDEIRKLFAAVPESRTRGFQPGHFSFNVKGGRCESCQGQGQIRVAMNFLPDVTVPCITCGGRRFTRETLAIRYGGASIAQVLEMTVTEAKGFFAAVPKVVRPLAVLDDLGLGYLTLGQPSPTLSGGEAQRIKLAAELTNHKAPTLYLLDEPTTGLHRADVHRLLRVLRALVEQGHTVVVIEHNLDFIAACDYVLDLGPASADEGGRLVACGPPEELARRAESLPSATARALRHHLKSGD